MNFIRIYLVEILDLQMCLIGDDWQLSCWLLIWFIRERKLSALALFLFLLHSYKRSVAKDIYKPERKEAEADLKTRMRKYDNHRIVLRILYAFCIIEDVRFESGHFNNVDEGIKKESVKDHLSSWAVKVVVLITDRWVELSGDSHKCIVREPANQIEESSTYVPDILDVSHAIACEVDQWNDRKADNKSWDDIPVNVVIVRIAFHCCFPDDNPDGDIDREDEEKNQMWEEVC